MKMQSITCYIETDLPYRVLLLFEINKLNLIGSPINIDLLLFGNEALSCDISFPYFWLNENRLKTPVAFLCRDHKCL